MSAESLRQSSGGSDLVYQIEFFEYFENSPENRKKKNPWQQFRNQQGVACGRLILHEIGSLTVVLEFVRVFRPDSYDPRLDKITLGEKNLMICSGHDFYLKAIARFVLNKNKGEYRAQQNLFGGLVVQFSHYSAYKYETVFRIQAEDFAEQE